jgi:HK97 family phage portal protein
MALGKLLAGEHVAKQGFAVPDGTQNHMLIPAFGGRPNLNGVLEPDGSFETFTQNGYRRNELVYACIAEKAQSLPQAVLRVYPRGSNEPIDDHRLRKLIEQPNPLTGEFEFFEMQVTYLDLAGICYSFIVRGRDGVPSQLWPLRPDLVGVLPSAADPNVYAWVYRPDPQRPQVQVVIPSRDMVVVRYPNPNPLNPADRYFGFPPLRPASRATSLDNAATDYVDRLLRNDATPMTLIMTQESIDNEIADRIRTRWWARHSGANRGGPAVLPKGMDVKVLGLNLRDLEFPDLRSISETRICMAFGVPPILIGAKVGLDRSTFANYQEARRSFWEETLIPLQRRFADGFRARLLAELSGVGRQRIVLDWDNSAVLALREAESAKWERATNALARGGITQNQFLRIVGFPPVPGGDQFLIPAGVVPTQAGEAGEATSDTAALSLLAAEYGIELTTEERLALTAGSEE